MRKKPLIMYWSDTDLRAACKLEQEPAWGEGQDLSVTANVLNTNGDVVVRAVVTMWVSPKGKNKDKNADNHSVLHKTDHKYLKSNNQ